MKCLPQSIPDVLLIQAKIHSDERGYFYEAHREDFLSEASGRAVRFVQSNQSFSRAGVVRGLHFQTTPCAQSKLVRVLDGEILDVVVDVRRSSPHYGRHLAVRLDHQSGQQLYVPEGFAHGFAVLSDSAVVNYLVSDYYSPTHSQGIIYNDPSLAIDWLLPVNDHRLSDQDLRWPTLSDQPASFP